VTIQADGEELDAVREHVNERRISTPGDARSVLTEPVPVWSLRPARHPLWKPT
jgi:hypothetical protein